MKKPCPPDPKSPSWWDLIKKTYNEWSSDNASRLAAAFSYYAIFSIGPILIIAISIVGTLYGQKAANDQIRPQIASMVGDKAADFIQDMIQKASVAPALSIAGILSILLLLYAATNLFMTMQDALNTIFNVKTKPGRGLKEMLRDRAFSFVSILVVGAFILASIVLSTFIAAITKNITVGNPAVTAFLLQLANFAVSALIFTGIFAFMFKYLPDIKITWRDTLIGAAFTAILFSLARLGLGYYLGRSSTASPFGAAGSLVVVMLFIYYSTQIFFLGAEFTQVWACRNGAKIIPSANAISTKQKDDENTPETDNNQPFAGKNSPKTAPNPRKVWKLNPSADPENTRRPPDRLHPPMRFAGDTPRWAYASIAAALIAPVAWLCRPSRR